MDFYSKMADVPGCVSFIVTSWMNTLYGLYDVLRHFLDNELHTVSPEKGVMRLDVR